MDDVNGLDGRLSDRDGELLSLYIDGELTPPEKEDLERRLESDRELRQTLDILTGLRGALGGDVDPPAELAGLVMERVNGELRRGRNARRRRFTAVFGSLAAAAVLALAVIPLAAQKSGAEDGMNYMDPSGAAEDADFGGSAKGYMLDPDDVCAPMSIAPGGNSLPVPDGWGGEQEGAQVWESVEEFTGGAMAEAYFDQLPPELAEDCLATVEFPGQTGYVITAEQLARYEELALTVTYPQGQWDYAVAVVPAE